MFVIVRMTDVQGQQPSQQPQALLPSPATQAVAPQSQFGVSSAPMYYGGSVPPIGYPTYPHETADYTAHYGYNPYYATNAQPFTPSRKQTRNSRAVSVSAGGFPQAVLAPHTRCFDTE
jgi:hypothetical protein